MTQILSHGLWQRYQPDTLPGDAPPHAMFARRESDGVDWYDFSRDSSNFSPDTVKFTALWQGIHNGYVIGAATRDVSRLFPAGQVLLEIIDWHGSDPQSELEQKLFNPYTRTLHDLPPLPPPPVFDFQGLEARVAVLEARVAALEARLGDAT